MEVEVKIARQEDPREAGVHQLGEPSTFACPECHGVLLQVNDGGHIRFRCHTGHAYSPESLLVDIREQIERQLWNAIRAIREGTLLMQTMAEHAEEVPAPSDSRTLRASAEELERQADTLRQMITSGAAAVHAE